MKQFAFLLSQDKLTITLNGRVFYIETGNANFDGILNVVKASELSSDQKFDKLNPILDRVSIFNNFHEKFKKNFCIIGGEVLFNGVKLYNSISERIKYYILNDLDPSPLINFLENSMQNPFTECVDAVFSFVDRQNPPITLTDDGYFIGYKAVTHDGGALFDGGQTKYKLGVYNYLDGQEYDHDSLNLCSQGIHVGTYRYAYDFGNFSSTYRTTNKIMLCKVNPADVISVASSSHYEKIRTRGMIPIAYMEDVTEPLTIKILSENSALLEAEKVAMFNINENRKASTNNSHAVADSNSNKPLRDASGRFISSKH